MTRDGKTVRESLAERRLLVITGKGGVGKSSLAATLGRSLAGARRRVLVIEVDPRENVHQLLDVEPSGGAVVDAGDGLFVQNLKPRDALDRLVEEHLGGGFLVRRILDSTLYQQLAEGMPGLRELAVLDYAVWRGQRGGDDGQGPFDQVILDAPATGHGLSLLAAPSVTAEVSGDGPVGEKAAELARFVADPERLGLVVVTLAEEMPVQEALELREELQRRLERAPELLVVNGLYPPLPRVLAAVEDAATVGEPSAAAGAVWHRRLEVQERELARLDQHWSGPAVHLAQQPLGQGRDLVAALRRELETGLDDLEEGSP